MVRFLLALTIVIQAVGVSADIRPAPQLAVCVYYDSVPEKPEYRLGEIYSIMFRNLLGHFKEVTPIQRAVKSYRSGDLASCSHVAYIGSYYEAPAPQEWLQDLADFDRPVMWFNYNIWKLQKLMGPVAFAKKTGFLFQGLKGFDEPASPDYAPTNPGFFKFFHYKGQTFRKMGYYDPTKGKFVASPELNLIKTDTATVLASAEHSKHSDVTTPYVTRQGNFFFVGDIPFAFTHEIDRYLITTDVLFDFLGLPPRNGNKHYALARIEDIHPAYDVSFLYATFKVFKDRHLPYSMTLIPRFSDPFAYTGGPTVVEIQNSPKFVKALRYGIANGARIIYHGYSHQLENFVNAGNGMSGDDYEFWDKVYEAPIPGATPEWVRGRLDAGMSLLHLVGIDPVAWVTPHYEASPDAYRTFGTYFSRTVQRGRYFPDPYDSADKISWAGQFFPYTIYKDVYGQYIWPENLGNVNYPLTGFFNTQTRTSDDILEAAKAQSVIRDSWGSFFWHPFLIPHLGVQDLQKIVDGLRALGYEFVDLEELKARGE